MTIKPGEAPPVEILLVEDNPGDYRLTQEALREGKVYNNLHWAQDGVEALDFLHKRGKYKEAVVEYQRVISDFPATDSVPAAHYKLGQTYMALKQNDLARKQFDTLMQTFPRSNEATLAKQALDRLK